MKRNQKYMSVIHHLKKIRLFLLLLLFVEFQIRKLLLDLRFERVRKRFRIRNVDFFEITFL